MTADELIQWLSQGLFVLIFLAVALQAARRPRRATIDTALLFGAAAAIVAVSWLRAAGLLAPHPALAAFTGSLLMALSYLTLRLVDDFAGVPRWLHGLAATGLAASVVVLVAVPPPPPLPLVILLVLYFAALELYCAARFVGAAVTSAGVTRRRMQAAAIGSLLLGMAILLAGLTAALPTLRTELNVAAHLAGLVSGLAFATGFTPPAWLRRAWQEPTLRAWLAGSAHLPHLPDVRAITRELEQGAATALGVPGALVGLWDEAAGVLRVEDEGREIEQAPAAMIGGRAFTLQRPVFTADAPRADPAHAAGYQAAGAMAVLAAPMTAGARRLGVLIVYARRAPIFAEDDLALLHLLAQQSAVILQSHALLVEAAQMRAREEAVRLKDDFLSAAAHELKTPLAGLVAQAQLLDRQARRQPEAPVDRRGLERLLEQARRMAQLVHELLESARAEQGRFVLSREPVDLAELARAACARHADERHPCRVEADTLVVGDFDRLRLEQVLDNLVENAIKYSPQGGAVRLRVWQHDRTACLTVTDRGIGIPPADLPHLFERFHRGSNVDDRRHAGLGLGLFLCRSIVEQHGGRLWATSAGSGRGSTFHVELPLAAPEQPAPSSVEGTGESGVAAAALSGEARSE